MPVAIRREPLTPEQSDLAATAAPLARWVARRMSRLAPWRFEEYADAATEAILEAARDFDPSRGFEFSALANRYAERSILNCAKHSRWRFRPFALREAGDELAVVMPRLADDSPDFREIISLLPYPDRELIRLRYEAGLSRMEVGSRFGRGPDWAGLVERRSIRKLREVI